MTYGYPGVYGVVTMPYSVREGINIFLAGFIPTENFRFRDDEITFKKGYASEDKTLSKSTPLCYPAMIKTLGSFKISIQPGQL